MAESAQAGGDEDMARELFAVERALGGALRRLRRFSRARVLAPGCVSPRTRPAPQTA